MDKLLPAIIVGVIAIDISVAISVFFQTLAKKGVTFFENVKLRTAMSFGIGAVLFAIVMAIV